MRKGNDDEPSDQSIEDLKNNKRMKESNQNISAYLGNGNKKDIHKGFFRLSLNQY
jgi:hypothetical protein